MGRRLCFDIETDSLEAPSVIHAIVAKDIDTGEIMSEHTPGGIRVVLDELSSAAMIVGHNIVDYDLWAISKIFPRWTTKAIVRDTMLCTRLMWTDLKETDLTSIKRGSMMSTALVGKHSLEAWGVRLGVLKGAFGKTADWSAWSEEMQRYCEQDVEVTHALWEAIVRKKWSEESIQLEHDFAEIISKMSRYGVAFDSQRAIALANQLTVEREAIREDLVRVFPPTKIQMKKPAGYTVFDAHGQAYRNCDTKAEANKACNGVWGGTIVPCSPRIKEIPFNPGSRKQIAERLKALGWQPTKKTDGGSDAADEKVLESLPYPEAKLLAKFFMLEKRLGQIRDGDNAWLKLERNGRIHGRLITNGAVTGRCAHHSPNLGQVPSVGSEHGTECRACFLASPPKVMVGDDASGLELRCLSHYLAAYDGGEYVKAVTGPDIHTVNQAAFGLEPGKEGRYFSKTGIYCKVYGGGPEKLGSSLVRLAPEHESKAQAMQLPKWAIKSLGRTGKVTKARVADWKRGKYAAEQIEKNIKGFDRLMSAVAIAAKERGYLVGLDGRRLKVRSAHSALNTLLQSAGALLVKKATVLWYRKLSSKYKTPEDFALVLHVHDEIQAEARPELAQEVGETFVWAIQEAGRLWNFRCPLNGEFKIGNNWAETH